MLVGCRYNNASVIGLRLIIEGKKGKGHPRTGHERPTGEQTYSSFKLGARWGCGWSTSRPGRFTPEKDPVCIVQEAGWASRAGLDGCGKISPPALNGIRYTDRPARSESLYRLR